VGEALLRCLRTGLARLTRIAARDQVRARVLAGAELDGYVGGVGPMRDA